MTKYETNRRRERKEPTMKTPPEKMSALLQLAVDDLLAVCCDARYSPMSGTWHDGEPGELCEVCLAGAVMAKTLDADAEQDLWPGDYDTDWREALKELDWWRNGTPKPTLRVPPKKLEAARKIVDGRDCELDCVFSHARTTTAPKAKTLLFASREKARQVVAVLQEEIVELEKLGL